MLRRLHTPLCVSLLLLAACAPVTPLPTPSPTSIPTRTLTPSPTSTPSPTPTATPIPPLILNIRWPEQVSALEPVSIEVELLPPPGVSVTPTVRAAVVGPDQNRWQVDLTSRDGNRYTAEELLQLPLEPPEGNWRLMVYVESELPVTGKRVLVFQPLPISFHDLTGALHAGVDMRVPLDFVAAEAQGDRWAGGRVWRYGDGEIALWWAPGPTEPLLLDNALVMLETTHDPNNPPQVLDVEETDWRGQTAFLFHEEWRAEWRGTDGCPAEALVIQGPDHWLYVLRVRTIDGDLIPPILRQVRETFTFAEE